MRFLSLILKHCVCLPTWKVLLKVKWNSTYFSEKSVRNLWTSFTGALHFSVESGKQGISICHHQETNNRKPLPLFYCHSNSLLLYFLMSYCISSHAEHIKALMKLKTYSSQFRPAYPSGHASHVGRPSSSRKHVRLNLEKKKKNRRTL